MTRSMPTSEATWRAAASLSPVRSTGSMPRERNWAMAAREVGLTVSRTTRTPRTRAPVRCSGRAIAAASGAGPGCGASPEPADSRAPDWRAAASDAATPASNRKEAAPSAVSMVSAREAAPTAVPAASTREVPALPAGPPSSTREVTAPWYPAAPTMPSSSWSE